MCDYLEDRSVAARTPMVLGKFAFLIGFVTAVVSTDLHVERTLQLECSGSNRIEIVVCGFVIDGKTPRYILYFVFAVFLECMVWLCITNFAFASRSAFKVALRT